MPKFNYAVAAIGQKINAGRSIPALIEKVTEQERQIGGDVIPQLAVVYRPPDGALEMSMYEGAVGQITPASDLGKLIQAFARMGIEDIGANNFARIVGRHVMLGIYPVQENGSGLRYKRFPARWLTDEETQRYFPDARPPLQFLDEHRDELPAILNGLSPKAIPMSLVSLEWAQPHMEEIYAAIDTGYLQDWLESRTALKLENGRFSMNGGGNG